MVDSCLVRGMDCAWVGLWEVLAKLSPDGSPAPDSSTRATGEAGASTLQRRATRKVGRILRTRASIHAWSLLISCRVSPEWPWALKKPNSAGADPVLSFETAAPDRSKPAPVGVACAVRTNLDIRSRSRARSARYVVAQRVRVAATSRRFRKRWQLAAAMPVAHAPHRRTTGIRPGLRRLKPGSRSASRRKRRCAKRSMPARAFRVQRCRRD